ncbi:MAG: hypothetical protein QOE90_2341 [Thermoplasmata archaeon]|nr:hypothetical protein [Thermoplasmata archaeon]
MPVLAPNPTQGKTLGQLNYEGLQDPRFAARVQHFMADHGVGHPQRLDMQGLSPLEVAQKAIGAEVRDGRTVSQWAQLGTASRLLALQPGAAAARGDLVTDVARLDAAAGFPLDAGQMARVESQAAALPDDVRQPFADLVHAVADAYVAQAPLAQAVLVAEKASGGQTVVTLSDAQREATLSRALDLVAAQNAFRAAVQGVAWPESRVALFADPNGLVILGSSGNDVYERTGVLRDPALLVDPAGDDTYHVTAGSACPDPASLIHDCNGLVASVLVDLAGDDAYAYGGRPTDVDGSASEGGIGLLVDAAGSDSYLASFAQAADHGQLWGGPSYYIDAGAQGYGLAAVGIQLDAAGNDRYEADVTSSGDSTWDLAQGFGNAGGVGILADGGGDDQYLAYGFDNGLNSFSFQGLYPTGTGFFGGVGVFHDTGMGNDGYHAWDNATTTDFYAYGFAAFAGTGIFVDDGGNDNFEAVSSATNPYIIPLLNCAFGTGSYAGLGVFVTLGGNDTYFGDTRSPRSVYTMNEGFGGPAEGEGVFVDVSGDDGHFMQAHPNNGPNDPRWTAGRGVLLGGGEGLEGDTIGTFLDLGGHDTYTGAPPSRDNAVWLAGMDINAGDVPAILPR